MHPRRTDEQGPSPGKGRGDGAFDKSERPVERTEIVRGESSGHSSASRPITAPGRLPPKHASRITSGTILWLRRSDQMLLGVLLIVLVTILIGFRWRLSRGGATPIEIVGQQPREYYDAIEINRASWVEWAQLDGIGEKLAKRIVENRAEQGPFASIDDIRRVRGIGPKLLEKLRPFLRCGPNRSTKSD